MRSLFSLAVIMSSFVLLAVHYSFWIAFGTLHLGAMLMLSVLAFTVRTDN